MKSAALSFLFLLSIAPASVLPAAAAEPLDELLEQAIGHDTDSLVISQDGQVILEWYRTGRSERILAWSVTKSLVSLATGLLIQDGKLTDLDTPVHEVFPEWGSGVRSRVKVRHLLNHTSGLDPDFRSEELRENLLKMALGSRMLFAPGERFEYNNTAAHLLSALVQKLSGRRTDLYVHDRIFEPLGIRDYQWQTDRAGHAYGSSGWTGHARDLLKIGELVLFQGRWRDRQLVDASWLRQSFTPSQPFREDCGLLWWMLNEDGRRAVFAAGYLGQYLVIVPEKRLVAVRMHRQRAGKDPDHVSFYDFPGLVLALPK